MRLTLRCANMNCRQFTTIEAAIGSYFVVEECSSCRSLLYMTYNIEIDG